MEEIWKPIFGYPRYFASDQGRIKGPKQILVQGDNGNGYLLVAVMLPTGPKTVGVHRLVALAFHSDTFFFGAYSCHKDHNKKNNIPDNLYWGTHETNTLDSVKNGINVKGERVGTSVLTAANVIEIRRRNKAGESGRSLAKEFGVGQPTVYDLLSGKTWRHLLEAEKA